MYAEKLRKLLGAEGCRRIEEVFSSRDPDVLHKAFSTGNPIVLREFVRWAGAKFPAEHYLLVMWGHAFGLGFGRDHGDPLAMTELAWALNRGPLKVPSDKGRRHPRCECVRDELRRGGVRTEGRGRFYRRAGDCDAVCGLALRGHSESD